MSSAAPQSATRRYQSVEAQKANGATYTPARLARFVAQRIVESAELDGRPSLTILDPAIGDGELVLALLESLHGRTNAALIVRGFDTDNSALEESSHRIRMAFPNVCVELMHGSFLDFALDTDTNADTLSLFAGVEPQKFDLVIANPPYVRTQIMGSGRAQQLSQTYGLTGRVDLYQAFLLSMASVLAPDGVVGVIVSNRFMTTKGGNQLRASLRERYALRQIWDLGDTKLFDAAVLPAVIVARGIKSGLSDTPAFVSIYEVKDEANVQVADVVEALTHDGIVAVSDGRRFNVRHGVLDYSGEPGAVWRLASEATDEWLGTVDRHTWRRFGEIGKIRVGVKTCADKVFIRSDWDSAFGSAKPELLRHLTTHHCAGRYRAISPKKDRAILYPHEVVQGSRRAISLERFPNAKAYLEAHRSTLERRSYVIEAGRCWYELWVPQDPQAWVEPKLVFRDISERPTFWIDLDGSVINGDCYWLTVSQTEHTDLLWLAAAVANSTFAEAFYDHRFNNKLYAGRRRFITQYVEQFPLPVPSLALSKDIVRRAKDLYEANHSPATTKMEEELDGLVWQAFGLGVEKIVG